MTGALVARPTDDLEGYLREVGRCPPLTRREEFDLACRLHDSGDVAAAHRLVVSNLRFVVKVAWEFRNYGLPLLDLVQEGNIGLMHAVKKFDPHRGYRLITYAAWWIRAAIQSYVVKMWSMVKVGSGKISRHLFYKLRSAKNKMVQDAEGRHDPEFDARLADRLGVSEDDVSAMEARLAARDFSLDAPLNGEAREAFLDKLDSTYADPEEETVRGEEQQLVRRAVAEVDPTLNEKERFLLDNRLLTEEPQTLEEVGSRFGVTRERVRQIEKRLLGKLREQLQSIDPHSAATGRETIHPSGICTNQST